MTAAGAVLALGADELGLTGLLELATPAPFLLLSSVELQLDKLSALIATITVNVRMTRFAVQNPGRLIFAFEFVDKDIVIRSRLNYCRDASVTRKVATRVTSSPMIAYSPGTSEVRGRTSMNTISPSRDRTRTVGLIISSDAMAKPRIPAWVRAVTRRAPRCAVSQTTNGGCVPWRSLVKRNSRASAFTVVTECSP